MEHFIVGGDSVCGDWYWVSEVVEQLHSIVVARVHVVESVVRNAVEPLA